MEINLATRRFEAAAEAHPTGLESDGRVSLSRICTG